MKKIKETKFTRYNEKCKVYCLRLRKEKDDKYIKFLESCPNRSEFIRKAIDMMVSE